MGHAKPRIAVLGVPGQAGLHSDPARTVGQAVIDPAAGDHREIGRDPHAGIDAHLAATQFSTAALPQTEVFGRLANIGEHIQLARMMFNLDQPGIGVAAIVEAAGGFGAQFGVAIKPGTQIHRDQIGPRTIAAVRAGIRNCGRADPQCPARQRGVSPQRAVPFTAAHALINFIVHDDELRIERVIAAEDGFLEGDRA